MGMRRAIPFCLALLLLHALLLYFKLGLASDLLEAVLPLAAASVAFAKARPSGGFEKTFWRLVGVACFIYALAQTLATYYDVVLQASINVWWPSDVAFLFFVAPLAMTLFVEADPLSPGAKATQALDFIQIGLVNLAAYLFLFYFPLQEHPGEPTVQMLNWSVFSTRDLILSTAFLLRAVYAGSERLRSLFGRVAIFLWLFSAGEYLYLRQQALYSIRFGTWYELGYSVPFIVLLALVMQWKPQPEPAVALKPSFEHSRAALVLAQAAHIIFPLMVLGFVQLGTHSRFAVAATTVFASFACSAARLYLSQTENERIIAAERTTARSLHKAEQRYRKLFERNRAGVFRSTLDGQIVECNEAFAAMYGYTREEVLRMPAHMLYFGGKAERESRIAAFRKVGEYSNYEICYRRKDGTPAWAIQNVALVQDENGAEFTEGTVVDITPRKLAEKEISTWKARYEAAVLASGQILFEWDPASNQSTFGGAVEGVLGYSGEEFQNKSREWRDLVHPDDLVRYVEVMRHAVDTLEPFEVEYRVRAKDGSYRSMREQARVIVPFEGASPRMVGFIADVTEQRDLELQLRQSQKMEAVGRLAGGVAHDFNNLLTIISGYSELLLESAASPGPRKQAEEIKSAAHRAASLTQQLLAFSRQQVLQPKVLDLNGIVREVERLLGRLIGEDIDLRTVLAPDLGLVEADPGQIEQILMNLVINSRDAMPRGGKLTIDTANAHLDRDYASDRRYVAPGDYVCLAVSDTGVGMDAETCSRIFEPFYTTKDVGKGTGLGLATVYGIVKQSRGHIEVYSAPGRGTTFKIYLPRTQRRSTGAATELQRTVKHGGSEKILLVEDDAQLRDLATAVLTSHGYTVFSAGDVNAVGAVCSGQQIDLLVTDVVMPHVSGKEIASQVIGHFPQVKVLYMSGYTTDAVVHHGVLEEGISFLQKPFSPATLAAKVREVLDAAAN